MLYTVETAWYVGLRSTHKLRNFWIYILTDWLQHQRSILGLREGNFSSGFTSHPVTYQAVPTVLCDAHCPMDGVMEECANSWEYNRPFMKRILYMLRSVLMRTLARGRCRSQTKYISAIHDLS